MCAKCKLQFGQHLADNQVQNDAPAFINNAIILINMRMLVKSVSKMLFLFRLALIN